MSDPRLVRQFHGGLSHEERARLRAELGPDVELVDLSANINPFGTPPSVLSAARTCQIDRYPESTAAELRAEYGRHLGLSPERIVFGNGASELLWTLVHHLRASAKPTLIAEPTFSEFARAAEVLGIPSTSLWSEAPNFDHDAGSIVEAVRRAGAGSLYLCRPNNPTGRVLPFAQLDDLARSLSDVSIILDESFLSLSVAAGDEKKELPSNVIRVRSLTKDFGIPGLRLGYLIASPEVAAIVERSRPPWTTSSPAQSAALAILNEEEFLAESRRALLRSRDDLQAWLSKVGLQAVPSATIFTLIHVGSGHEVRTQLMRHGVIVRDTASFGLPEHVRVAVGSPEMQARLRAAIESELEALSVLLDAPGR